jgi:hypothetical protein
MTNCSVGFSTFFSTEKFTRLEELEFQGEAPKGSGISGALGGWGKLLY